MQVVILTPRGTQLGPLNVILVAVTGDNRHLINFVEIPISEADGLLGGVVLYKIMFIDRWVDRTNRILA